MSQDFEAIFQNGVLRPLQPVAFRENETVSLSVRNLGEVASAADDQRAKLLAFVARMESLEEPLPGDAVTNRDHDLILYGRRA